MDLKRAIAISMVAVVVALLPLWVPAAQAQEQRPEQRMERSPTPIPIAPPKSVEVEKDVQQAQKELKAQQRTDAIARDNVKTVPSRPDLGQDVAGGIQSRAVQDALRRR
ncbi:MAG TPA: hypothetical protein VFO18_11990 [Methylomirabilota bacterium]|nr:hypothetical protein [Methylomirabilota bacterium]